MFFPRLRRKAKWVFLLLAIAFAGGFLVFGVGTGGGSGIGDFLSELLNRQPSGEGPSVEQARERIAQDPENATAHLELARALQVEGRDDEAATAFEDYLRLRPRDLDALRQLAALYETQAAELRTQVEDAQREALEIGQSFLPPGTLLADATAGKITQVLLEKVSARANEASAKLQQNLVAATNSYERLVKLDPNEPIVYLQLAQTAVNSGDYARALIAYEGFLRLAPEDPNVPAIKRYVKELHAYLGRS